MNLEFREMTPEDADEVAKIESRSFSMPWDRRAFFEECLNENTFYFVAMIEQKIVGYIGSWIVQGEAQITNIAVDPDFRRRGIGESMLKEFESIVKNSLGVAAMTLEVRPSNLSAIHLYEKFGFRSVGRRPRYYVDNNEDAIIMWKTKI